MTKEYKCDAFPKWHSLDSISLENWMFTYFPPVWNLSHISRLTLELSSLGPNNWNFEWQLIVINQGGYLVLPFLKQDNNRLFFEFLCALEGADYLCIKYLVINQNSKLFLWHKSYNGVKAIRIGFPLVCYAGKVTRLSSDINVAYKMYWVNVRSRTTQNKLTLHWTSWNHFAKRYNLLTQHLSAVNWVDHADVGNLSLKAMHWTFDALSYLFAKWTEHA